MTTTHRPTTIERAYHLAQSGTCRTISDVKKQLHLEGYERVQDRLYGASITAALRKLCQEHYKPSPLDDSAALHP